MTEFEDRQALWEAMREATHHREFVVDAELLCPCMMRQKTGQPPWPGMCGCMGPRGLARVMRIEDVRTMLDLLRVPSGTHQDPPTAA